MFAQQKFQIHPLFLLVSIIAYFLGMFVELICLSAIVLTHEMGHYLAAKYFRWNVSKIVLWPFGGVMETEDYYNRPSKEELIVTVAGPLQHIWIYGFIYLLSYWGISTSLTSLLLIMNTVILIFNLLPILPLDGGRFLFIALNKVIAFHRAIATMTIISMLMIVLMNGILLIIGWYNIQLTWLSVFLLLDNWFTWQSKHIFLLKHLLSRYFVSNVDRSDVHILQIPSGTPVSELVKQFKKGCYHFVHIENEGVLTEDECLKILFTQHQWDLSLNLQSEVS
ncbi:M50 family metallopeptidase [Alkalibacillus aidingensis]|uniref:M50 family metallopeptidase n=1 Tax=Alkalibacillus aidingensis TaxID=2747607 RepID=UPI0016611622|nr:M50 family metallopeptidase [Alkalibacillus aidingensis]